MNTQESKEPSKKVKCVIWDLDNTLWDGVLLEDETVTIRSTAVDIIKALDERGILQSIASKNDYHRAIAKIDEFGLTEYFLYPQINWGPKSKSAARIAEAINIGIDTLAFVDDQAFEQEEMRFAFPDVLCIDGTSLDGLLDMPELNPRFVTKDARNRRQMYFSAIERKQQEDVFEGPKEAFLASLEMSLSIRPATEDDLMRAEELTVRTHQLNTSGATFTYEELNEFRISDEHILLVVGLDDKFGSYGTIGLALIERDTDRWIIRLLLMSCRVMSTGVGSILINQIRRQARMEGVRLQAVFVPTDVNRMMYVAYKFANFREIDEAPHGILLENELVDIVDDPAYVKIQSKIL